MTPSNRMSEPRIVRREAPRRPDVDEAVTDDPVQPLAKRHARRVCGVEGIFPDFRLDSPDVPWLSFDHPGPNAFEDRDLRPTNLHASPHTDSAILCSFTFSQVW